MKQNNNNRRARGRGPRKPHGMGGGHNKGQSFDGGGHETRVRGNAYQVLEKYLQLARDAGSAGDRVAAENYLQHADHYYRVLSAMNDGQRPRVGGRELSVADVNVQNVSQGLSAALYTSGGQGMGGMNEPGNQAQGGQGSQDLGDGQGQQRSGQDGGQERRQDRGQQQGQQHGQQQHGQNRGHGQHAHQGQPRQGQGYQPQGQQPDAGGGNGHDGSYANVNEQPPSVYAPAPEPARAGGNTTGDEQPDYPEELLPAAAPAAEAPAEPAPEAQGRTLRSPRGRMRGQGRRGRTPEGNTQDNVEPTE